MMKGTKKNGMTKDEYYMTIAKIAGMQYDGRPHAATCVVDKDDRILLIGSEITDAFSLPEGADPDVRMYISEFPDMDTAAKILDSHIQTIIYDEDGISDSLSSIKIINNLISAGITCRKYKKAARCLRLHYRICQSLPTFILYRPDKAENAKYKKR